jgi:hypothetical protein
MNPLGGSIKKKKKRENFPNKAGLNLLGKETVTSSAKKTPKFRQQQPPSINLAS